MTNIEYVRCQRLVRRVRRSVPCQSVLSRGMWPGVQYAGWGRLAGCLATPAA